MSLFIETEVLQWMPLSCINRDDAGLPKSMLLGGERRARWSSQSQKFAVRRAFATHLQPDNLCFKTRRLPILALHELIQRGYDPHQAATRVTSAMFVLGLNMNTVAELTKQASEGSEAATEENENVAEFGKVLTGRTQVIVPAPAAAPQVLADAVEAHWDELDLVDLDKLKSGKAKDIKVPAPAVKSTMQPLRKAIDATRLVDVALFGRMLTEIPDGSVDGTVSVAHAFTTHPDDFTSEFWSAVDDDAAHQGHGGSANMGTQGLTSGCFYRYASVDVDALRAEGAPLAGDDQLIVSGVTAFVEAFARLMPRAMVHSSAPYIEPAVVIVTVSDGPRSNADAFVRPIEDGDYLAASAQRLAEVTARKQRTFGGDRRVFVLPAHPDVDDIDFGTATVLHSMDDLVDQVRQAVAHV